MSIEGVLSGMKARLEQLQQDVAMQVTACEHLVDPFSVGDFDLEGEASNTSIRSHLSNAKSLTSNVHPRRTASHAGPPKSPSDAGQESPRQSNTDGFQHANRSVVFESTSNDNAVVLPTLSTSFQEGGGRISTGRGSGSIHTRESAGQAILTSAARSSVLGYS